MNATQQKAVATYQQIDVDTAVLEASPHKLILMLFEGAVKALARARIEMKRNNVPEKCEAISKAMRIIQDGLQLGLDRKAGGELADNLNELYEYMCLRLLQANLKNDIAAVDEVAKLLLELKGAWEEMGKQLTPQCAPKPEVRAESGAPMQRLAMSYGKA